MVPVPPVRDDGAMRETTEPKYDIVVVGAGAAGAVIAARASEDPSRSVLLLDAGPDYPIAAELPEDLYDGHDNSYVDHDWGLSYQPLTDRTDRFPRGRVTGGSSAVNTTIALRGIPADYDEWAALGNPGWAWADVLPAFNRLERDLDFGTEPYHGDAGPISIRRWNADELVPTQAAFIEAAVEHGFPRCDDVNAPDAVGVGPMAMNKLGRLRISTAVGYLSAARYRANLTIRPNTLVRRVIVEAGRATGVETAASEQIDAGLVVVSAGAIHTPGVLVRSGIGDADELASLGIDPVAVVPGVGANLSDHPALAILLKPKFPEFCAPDLPLVQTICRYTTNGSTSPLDVNIELITRSRGRDGSPMFMLAPSLEQVDGRGTVRQSSSTADSMPTISTCFGENDRDVHRHVEALEDAFALTRLAPLRDFIEEVSFPDPARSSRADLETLARRVSASGYHPCGTAKMGPADDPMAVVDHRGRCHAVDQLVVADASIMPTVPRANINLSTIMIGEMVGEWLRTDPAGYGL